MGRQGYRLPTQRWQNMWVLNGRAAISPEMALRIEKWLGVENAERADVWLAEQTSYDLWQTRSYLLQFCIRICKMSALNAI